MSDQRTWRLYQFDFTGLRNTSEVLRTGAGKARSGVCVWGGVLQNHLWDLWGMPWSKCGLPPPFQAASAAEVWGLERQPPH